ncbi:MAG: AraC family transcriptional regulator [Corynebacterium sp.]|nr:AraC family transcriptional regulator [Corynebacterium sp.]
MIAVAESGRLKAQMPEGEAFVQAGDVMLLGPESSVQLREKHDVHMSLITVDPNYFIGTLYWLCPDSFRDHLEAHDFFSEAFKTKVHHARITPATQQRLRAIVNEICALSAIEASLQVKCKMQSWWSALMNVLFPVMIEVPLASWARKQIRATRHLPDNTVSRANDSAIKTKRLLEGAIDKDWSLDLLARKVHMSSRQVARTFKETFGLTPTEYLTSLRVHAMAKLLRETNDTIAKVAQTVGWESRARASSAFAKHFGISPGTYRTQSRRGLTLI